jgi:hypothetical protein
VSSEYGWTDEQIGELPLARFRQITAAIQVRRYGAAREENSRTSWLARNIATYIAAGFEVGKGKENKALTQASKLAYDDIEALMLGGTPSTGEAKPAENKPGSYERFMMMNHQLQQRGKML